MFDYMQELQRTFSLQSSCKELRLEISSCYQQLIHQLSRKGQIELLHLVDLETELSDKLAFSAFVSGFRLAGGIAAELSQEAPFSFEAAEECRIHKQSEQESKV